MKAVFERFGLVLNASSLVMTEMYQFLTGDSFMTVIDEQVRLKFKFMLDSQDPDVIYNLRDINPGRPQKYEQLAGLLPSAGFCYGESAPASFDVCELVATEGSCYNDGQVLSRSLNDSESNRLTTGSQGSDN